MVIRRRDIHWVFAGLGLLFAGMTIYHAVQWHRLGAVNQAIAAASTGRPEDVPTNLAAPQVTLAHALALARAGDFDQAVKEYTRLTARTPADATSREALYNLGNLYLRRGMALAGESSIASVPFIELAKQRYRDLLRSDPDVWDARYNLERALRLAPEAQSVFSDFGRESERRPNIEPRDDVVTPELP